MAVVEAKKKKKQAPKAPEGPRVDETLMEPGKYEVTPEHTFDIEMHLKVVDNRWIIMKGVGKDTDTKAVTLRMWNYEEMVDMRKKATTFDPVRRMHLVDTDLLDRLKVQKLMVSWTFEKDNPRLKLHRVNGVLTDESWTSFKLLHTNIIRHILERMNDILEYNG